MSYAIWMRPPNSGITITFRYSFSSHTTFHSFGVGSLAIDSMTGYGYTTPLDP